MNKLKFIPLQIAVAAGLVVGVSQPAFGQDAATPTAPDNTKMNKKADKGVTADSQKNDKSDVKISAQIRKALHADKTLSTYAHNVKIVTVGGMVTLKGPVRSDDEKSAIEKKATEIAGAGKVTNQLTVAPGKSKT